MVVPGISLAREREGRWAMGAANAILAVRSVDKTYARRKVVDTVSFEVRAGEVMGILGPNGAGKTTIIRMIMGITAPDRGEIAYNLPDGRSRGIPKSQVGYVPEERGLYKDTRVMDTLVYLAGLKQVDPVTARARARVWLERMDLLRWSGSRIDRLSKGMAQKVQLIASVLHGPRLIVMDEPFSGLDPLNQDLFKEEVRRLAAEGAAVLLSSHQMNLVEETCDRILFLHRGKRVFYGDTDEVRARFGGFKAVLRGPGPFAELERSPLVASAEFGAGIAVFLLKPEANPARFAAAIPPDALTDEITVSRPTLHDIFVGLAKEVPDEDAADV
jgi:ABC-2 type transport system ATP-binding protein